MLLALILGYLTTRKHLTDIDHEGADTPLKGYRVPLRISDMNEFTTENTREQIAHLLADAQKAIISRACSLADVEIKIHAATALINEVLKHEANHGG